MCKQLRIEIPLLAPPECSPNWTGHWGDKAKAVKQFRTDAFLCMVSERNKLRNFEGFNQCSIDATFHVPDLRYVMDDDNARATLKAVQDALVDAEIINKNDRGVKVRSIGFIPYSEMAPAIVLEIHAL